MIETLTTIREYGSEVGKQYKHGNDLFRDCAITNPLAELENIITVLEDFKINGLKLWPDTEKKSSVN